MDEAIGYIRKSTKDQSHYSLEYQEEHIRAFCERNKVGLKALFVDDGESSYTFDRPDYKALEKFIVEHKKTVRYLIVLDHDRFSRNLPEALMKIDQLEKRFNLKVIATNESLDIDTNDPMVFMSRAFKYLVANQELFTIRRRAKMGIRQAQMQGRYVNQAPFGYVNEKRSNGRGIIQVDKTNAHIVKKIFRDYLSGIPVYLIYKEVLSLGFPQRGNSSIPRILSNPLYAGLVRVNASNTEEERFVKGLHEPIIPEEQFWRAYEMIQKKRPQKSQPKDEFPLRGLLHSSCCGTPMTAGWTKGRNKYYLYYRCIKHGNINIPGDLLHEKFGQLLRGLSFTKQQKDLIKKMVEEGVSHIAVVNKKRLDTSKQALEKLEEQLTKTEAKFINDEINAATYKKWQAKFATDRMRLTAEIKELQGIGREQVSDMMKFLPDLLDLQAIFERSSVSQKHALIREIFSGKLIFEKGYFKVKTINPAFGHNLSRLKEDRVLEVEHPPNIWDTRSISNSDKANILGHLQGIFALLNKNRTSVKHSKKL
ncbi:recombinase family protein [Chitinophaga oryzae]|uniref:Recombinase family protein n=1 Tax=Chitinophaga oryzae TaxID=2725414 RepID=A0AAE6ZLH2_9BACT|nr:recombinase family protein [Chitinophaga oryzae]QJB34927.1 recombinase family protein [Chitinophaga oryzae]QJB41438.1 recombinase family protein [Chitinophaga oryzae]